jgi:hypothetical protein
MQNRIAFITESSRRQKNPMPAHLFYQGPNNRWVNNVIQYMETRKFPTQNIFFLSHFKQRIIPYDKTIHDYPIQKKEPSKAERLELAKKILDFLLSYEETPFVEFHTGKRFYEAVLPLLDEHGINYRIYAEGVALGQKDTYYQELIEEEQQQRRMKRIQGEKRILTGLIEFEAPYYEAKQIIDDYDKKAHLFGVENEFDNLKYLVKKYYQRQKDAVKARDEVDEILQKGNSPELEPFLRGKESISALMKDLSRYEQLKHKYGKELAKYSRYLIKQEYAKQTESKISDSLLRLQIALLRQTA